MAKKTKTEAAKPESTGKELAPVAKQSQALIQRTGTKIAGKGFENLEREDILLPRLKLLQSVSPEVMELDMEAGTILINLSNRNLGKEIKIIPILHFRSRILWKDKEDGGGIDCSAPDAKTPRDTKYATTCSICPKKDWNEDAKTKKDSAPECSLFENFIVFINDESEPVVLSMSSTKIKVARKWYSMMAVRGGDMFDYVYKLSVVKEKGAETSYYNYNVADAGKKTDAQRRAQCNSVWESLSKATVTIADPEKPEEARETAGAGTGKY